MSNGRQALIDRQNKMMFERNCWEDMQTEFSTNIEIYRLCQWAMDMLDEMCERIRHTLESEVCQ